MLKPRVKRAFPPLPLEAGTDRHMWQLLRLMDGSRSVEQICAAMRDRDPALTDEEIQALLDRLIGAGYVEDAAAADAFDIDELERYRRDVELFGLFNHPPLSGHDYRQRLRKARVTVLGVGGTGSYAALGLAAAGVGELLLVDDSRGEGFRPHALYTEADAGRPAAEAAAERLGLIHPEVAVYAASNVDGLRECMRGRDLLVCAVDRRGHGLVNEAALAEGVPWLRCADDGLIAGMFLHVPGQTACLECERRSAGPMTIPSEAANPYSAPAAGLIGSMAALEAVKLLSGAMEPATLGRRLIFDLRTMNIRFQDGFRAADCPVCRGGGGFSATAPASDVPTSE